MNRSIRQLGLVLGLLGLVLFAQLNRVQFLGAERLVDHPQNSRGLVREFARQRGSITTADGVAAARSVAVDPGTASGYRRVYPEGEMYAHIVGYQALHAASTGLERSYNDELAGRTVELQFSSPSDLFDLFGERDTTASLQLTVRADLQEAARRALGDRRGSVVLVEPASGAVLALWSYPSFDPNRIAAADAASGIAAYDEYLADPDDPLLAKSYREAFFPGSTFKLVTAAAGLETGRVSLAEPVFERRDAYQPIPAGTPIGNAGGSTCGGDLTEILVVSCNTAFAEMGAEWVGPEAMVRTAEAFGFNSVLSIDLPSAAVSRFPVDYGTRLADRSGRGHPDVGVYTDSARLAQTAIGQNDVAATPLQMAMAAAAIANEGRLMAPHVVARLTTADGAVHRTIEHEIERIATSPETAALLRAAMAEVVRSGTAQGLRIDGLEIGAKTGTAQLTAGAGRAHAWTVGFAGVAGGRPELAFAVIVEASDHPTPQSGSATAVPVARELLEAFVSFAQAP